MILALDPSRVMGWAAAEPGGPLEFGHHVLAKRGSRPGQVGMELAKWLPDLIATTYPRLIVYEQPFTSPNFQTDFVLKGIGFTIDTIAETLRIDYYSVLALEATKALTGRAKFPGKDYTERRKAKKLATVEACRARGWDATEDEADAIAILLLAESKRFPEAALSRPRVLKVPKGPLFEELFEKAREVRPKPRMIVT
jgi:hypothetical protein